MKCIQGRNFGLPALVFPAAGDIAAAVCLRVDPVAERVEDLACGRVWTCQGIPAHLMEMVAAGGLMPWLKQRLKEEQPG